MSGNNARTAPPFEAAQGTPAERVLGRIRMIVLGLVALGLAGTSAELILIAHTEDTLQLIPLATMAAALAAVLWRMVAPRRAAVLAVQLAMLAMIVTGLIGVVLHFQANMEFQLEMDQSLGGMKLIMMVLEAKSPPALAPGNMALLGCIGLAGVYRDRFGG
jgi:hypothetical protein